LGVKSDRFGRGKRRTAVVGTAAELQLKGARSGGTQSANGITVAATAINLLIVDAVSALA